MSNNDTYMCEVCGGEFENCWSEEEMEFEMNKNFPGISKSDCAKVCDDCYNVIINFRT